MQSVNRFRQRGAVAVAQASHRRFYRRLAQALALLDGYLLPALARRDVREVRHLQLIVPVCLELLADPVRRVWCIGGWGKMWPGPILV